MNVLNNTLNIQKYHKLLRNAYIKISTSLTTELSKTSLKCIETNNGKSIQIQSYFCVYFPIFGLNTEIYYVFSPNTGKYGPGKTP